MLVNFNVTSLSKVLAEILPANKNCIHKLWIACSGGSDSIALLQALAKVPPQTHWKIAGVLHANHQLHAQSNDWQLQVEELSQQLNLPCLSSKLGIPPNGNLEEQARKSRYLWFRQATNFDSTAVIVTAHHAEDLLVNQLSKILRSASVSGLAGLAPFSLVGNLKLLRPLLAFSRESLRTFNSEHGYPWIEDSSNEDLTMERNFWRFQLLPKLFERYPHALSNITRHHKQRISEAQVLREVALADLDLLLVNPKFATKVSLDLGAMFGLSQVRWENVLLGLMRKEQALPSTQALESLFNQLAGKQLAGKQVSGYQDLLHWSKGRWVVFDRQLHWLTPDQFEADISDEPLQTSIKLDGDGVEIPLDWVGNIQVFRGSQNSMTWSRKKCCQILSIPPWLRNSTRVKVTIPEGFDADELKHNEQDFWKSQRLSLISIPVFYEEHKNKLER